jgi:hypothetical protein
MGARQSLEERGLANAVWPHDASDFTFSGSKINTMQYLAAAVVKGKPRGFQH